MTTLKQDSREEKKWEVSRSTDFNNNRFCRCFADDRLTSSNCFISLLLLLSCSIQVLVLAPGANCLKTITDSKL